MLMIYILLKRFCHGRFAPVKEPYKHSRPSYNACSECMVGTRFLGPPKGMFFCIKNREAMNSM